MRNLFVSFCVIALCLSAFTGTSALTNQAFSFLKAPDKSDNLNVGSSRYRVETDEEIVDQLVNDIVRNKFIDDEFMKETLLQLRDQLLGENADTLLAQLRGKTKQTQPSEPTDDTQGDSLLDKGLKFLRGLLGGDDSQSDDQATDPNSSPSPDDQGIMEDIEKYLDGIIDSKNGTIDSILRYVVSYVHKNVHFWLFTRNENGYEDLTVGRTSNVSKSDFNPSKKTIILIHGWINGGDSFYAKNMINAFDKFGDFNIISVDWAELSYSLYTLSRLSVNFVGPYVAQMVDFLAKRHDLKVSDLHILGHSLGAHIAGIAGSFVKSGKVGHITGFDPASPLFGDNKKYRLDASDAKFVDVIHTSFLGLTEQIGHIDFYPNGGGPSQPGCGLDVAVCPHRRSYIYYIASMTDNNFLAYACNSWDSFTAGNCTTRYVHMGIHAPKRRRGKFYLRTAGEAPFALGVKTLDPEEDPTPKPLRHRHKYELV